MNDGPGPNSDPLAVIELADPGLDTMAWRMSPDEVEDAAVREGKVKQEVGAGEAEMGLRAGGNIAGASGSGSRSRERKERDRDQAPPCHTFTAFVWSCSLMKKSRQIMTLM
jgi:hypothetical protein